MAIRTPRRRGHPPGEQAGEQDRRRAQLREGHVALAHEPDADGRRVSERGVPLEVGAGHEVDEVQCRHRAEADEHRVDRALPGDEQAQTGDHRAHPDHERPVRGRAAVATEVQRAGQVGRVEVPEEPERDEREEAGRAIADATTGRRWQSRSRARW